MARMRDARSLATFRTVPSKCVELLLHLHYSTLSIRVPPGLTRDRCRSPGSAHRPGPLPAQDSVILSRSARPSFTSATRQRSPRLVLDRPIPPRPTSVPFPAVLPAHPHACRPPRGALVSDTGHDLASTHQVQVSADGSARRISGQVERGAREGAAGGGSRSRSTGG